jgi:hypothetical protein
MADISQLPATQNHSFIGGDGYGFVVDVAQGGAPLDLTAYVIETAIVSAAPDAPTEWNVTREPGSVSRVRYWLTGAQTRALAPVSKYEIQMTPPGGEPRTYLRGVIRMTEELVV